ncbi:MAG TPA: methyltransferase domain-containing protein [Capsulimonadaceae bacterium]|jgi:ubiquinone/menaquinone biosynthesis C-methylase UbiE
MTPPNDISIREYILSFADWSSASSVLDLGCGDGYDLRQIAWLAGSSAMLVGLDSSHSAIDSARALTSGDNRFSFSAADIANGLPSDDNTFDFVISKNLLECIIDKTSLLKEIHRVLKPGGQVICAHYDWDSQLFDGDDKPLVRNIVHAFSDWQQAWMTSSDAWMGRRLWRTFQESGLFHGTIHTKALTETDFAPGTYGWHMVNDFRGLVRRGLVAEEDFARFYTAIESLATRGEYLYGITMFVYSGAAIAPSAPPTPAE